MNLNGSETRRVLDEGLLTRSLIESEVSMKKCQLYSDMANDATIKTFFKDQSKGLEDVCGYFKNSISSLK